MPMKTVRYFRDHESCWKFEEGQPPLMKKGYDSPWTESYFSSLEEFLQDPGDIEEVPREEVEKTTFGRSG